MLVVIVAAFPFLRRSVGPILPGPLDSVGTLSLLTIMFVVGALAMTLYLLVGVTGMLSFGHGVYFAIGAYGTVIMSNTFALPLWASGLFAVVLSTAVSAVFNGLALRAGLIGFSMVTLAFAELLALNVAQGNFGSGGQTGLTLSSDMTPEAFRGIVNSRNLYWLALALMVVIFVVVRFVEAWTKFGEVLRGIRENELRAESVGYNVYGYKLTVAILASFLASVCGVVFALVIGGAQPDITQVLYSLGLVLMVILGGREVLWGALLGGLVYTYLNLRLSALVGPNVDSGLPDFLAVPLGQPAFILGTIFVLIILFLPGGLASGIKALWRWISRKSGRHGIRNVKSMAEPDKPKMPV
jgi:branched-chain amino acid transport system permease protein